MNQLAPRPPSRMTADEFLRWNGDGSGRTFQLVDGEVRPMSPASRIHAIIQANVAFLLVGAVRASAPHLQVLTEGAVIPALEARRNVRVPDLVVAPSDDERGEQVARSPCLVVEILSPGNAASTLGNVEAYATLPSVREIVVIHTSQMQADVHARTEHGSWPSEPSTVRDDQRLLLNTVGLACALREAYATTWLTR